MYDFANLLFSGPCNARCYFCIGQEIDPTLQQNNLKVFPPDNLEAFIALILKHQIHQVVFTGTNTDPQLYRYEARLLDHLREQLPPETCFALHTNGCFALYKIETFNLYDRATISLPSFNPCVYQQMMGIPGPPNLKEIMHLATIPIKISCLLTAENEAEIPEFLIHCHRLGIQRVVLRTPFGKSKYQSHIRWDQLLLSHKLPIKPRGEFRSNPVFDFQEMEITLWDFEQSASRSINLFASGLISSDYLLTKANLTQSGLF